MALDVGHLEGRTVFVTGGAGFFGRAFAEAVLDSTRETKLVVFSRDEAKHARMAEQLRRHRDRLRFRLGDVRDPERLRVALWKADVVVHCAALKRVDDTARHTFEVVRTNVIGTHNTLAAAVDAGVHRTLVLSSDKSALPSTSYGATKLLAERLAVDWNAVAFARGQLIAALRYGNVLGSTGSVLHVFRRAIRSSEAIPVTDSAMSRFWMTAEQAVVFVCRCLRIMRGGEIFIPKLSAAPNATLIAALNPPFGIRQIPKRPGGEKVHEVLLSEHESDRAVDLGDCWVLEPETPLPVEREPWKGESLPDGFRYASASAPNLTVSDLAAMAAGVADE